MRPEANGFEIPEDFTTPAERATYCRNRATGLVELADKQSDEDAKLELLNRAEHWMMLAFRYRRLTN